MATTPKNPDRKIILIVDDVQDNIEILGRILSPEYKIRVALNGTEALQVAESSLPPDLILLDVMMPDISGFDVCRKLKAQPNTRRIPVIFVTAKSEEYDEVQGFDAGGVDYITKPISPMVVLARVKTHLKLLSTLQELETQKERFEKLIKLYVSESTYDLVKEAVVNPEKIFAVAKELTIFFIDIVGFTTLSESLGPEKMVQMLNLFLEVASQVIKQHFGDIDKFIGDCIMATFLNPLDAVDAAKKITEITMPDLNKELEKMGFPGIKVRIGINTGRLIHGDIGASFRKDKTVIGDVVNTASRVESVTPPGCFLISENVLSRLPDTQEFEFYQEILLKGKSFPTKVFKLK
ncbi:MAG: response regulator [Candidatus Riflebacteria bacterium]|nr:response regulator [Candidatus Riflebacteria bacterium]